MSASPSEPTPGGQASTEPTRSVDPEPGSLLDDELLVEEISIDGMCGVY